MLGEWTDPERVTEYLSREIPHRDIAESLLLDALPQRVGRVLDLGTGDGRLLAYSPTWISWHRPPRICTSAFAGRSGKRRTTPRIVLPACASSLAGCTMLVSRRLTATSSGWNSRADRRRSGAQRIGRARVRLLGDSSKQPHLP